MFKKNTLLILAIILLSPLAFANYPKGLRISGTIAESITGTTTEYAYSGKFLINREKKKLVEYKGSVEILYRDEFGDAVQKEYTGYFKFLRQNKSTPATMGQVEVTIYLRADVIVVAVLPIPISGIPSQNEVYSSSGELQYATNPLCGPSQTFCGSSGVLGPASGTLSFDQVIP